MPKLACKIPEKVALACSGGADSMSALSFLLKGKREVVLLHFNHGTKGSDIAEDFVLRIAEQSKLNLRNWSAKDDIVPFVERQIINHGNNAIFISVKKQFKCSGCFV